MSVPDHQDFLTFPEVQNYLGIKSRKTILKYIKTGELPAYKVGGTRWRIARTDVENFLKKCSTEVVQPPEQGKQNDA